MSASVSTTKYNYYPHSSNTSDSTNTGINAGDSGQYLALEPGTVVALVLGGRVAERVKPAARGKHAMAATVATQMRHAAAAAPLACETWRIRTARYAPGLLTQRGSGDLPAPPPGPLDSDPLPIAFACSNLKATHPQPPWLTGCYHPRSTIASNWDYRPMRRTRR